QQHAEPVAKGLVAEILQFTGALGGLQQRTLLELWEGHPDATQGRSHRIRGPNSPAYHALHQAVHGQEFLGGGTRTGCCAFCSPRPERAREGPRSRPISCASTATESSDCSTLFRQMDLSASPGRPPAMDANASATATPACMRTLVSR